jgi:hypothetical protein
MKTNLIERLRLIFPNLQMTIEGKYSTKQEHDYNQPLEITWYDFLEILEENKLEITAKHEINNYRFIE